MLDLWWFAPKRGPSAAVLANAYELSVCRVLPECCALLICWFIIAPAWDGYYYSHSSDGEAEAQGDQISCRRSCRQLAVELDSHPGTWTPELVLQYSLIMFNEAGVNKMFFFMGKLKALNSLSPFPKSVWPGYLYSHEDPLGSCSAENIWWNALSASGRWGNQCLGRHLWESWCSQLWD